MAARVPAHTHAMQLMGLFNDDPDDGVWMNGYLDKNVWGRSDGPGEFVTN